MAQKMSRNRYDALNEILLERRREIGPELEHQPDSRRSPGHKHRPGAYKAPEDELELALLAMKAETLAKIDEALSRLEAGNYGYCFECGEEISESRLRALPFAVRCKDCDQAADVRRQQERQRASRRSIMGLFP